MTGYFKQIIFPPKPIIIPTTEKSVVVITDVKARAMFETVYCYKQDKWFSMVECIDCRQSNKTLEEIMEDGIGCMGSD
jgi:hypothetical protein